MKPTPLTLRRLALAAVTLLAASCSPDESISGQAQPSDVFVLQTLDGAAVPARITLSFPEPGRIAGEAPCNRYFGRQTAPLPWVEIDQIGATKRACPDLALESRYLQALQDMTLIELTGDTLVLTSDAGREMTFRRD